MQQLEFLKSLIQCENITELQYLLLETLPSGLGGNHAIWAGGLDDSDPSNWFVSIVSSEAVKELVDEKIAYCFAHILEHPALSYCRQDNMLTIPLRLDDLEGYSEFLDSDLYQKFYLPCGFKHVTVCEIFRDTRRDYSVTYTLGSEGKLSDEAFKSLSSLLEPIYQTVKRLYKDSERESYLKAFSRAKEKNEVGYITVHKHGEVLKVDGIAQEFIEQYRFSNNGTGLSSDTISAYFYKQATHRSEEREVVIAKTIAKNEARSLLCQCVWSRRNQEQTIFLWEVVKQEQNDLSKDLFRTLTTRENDVMQWVLKAKSNVEIAIILGISKRTVDNHMAHIFKKLGVANRIELVQKVNQSVS